MALLDIVSTCGAEADAELLQNIDHPILNVWLSSIFGMVHGASSSKDAAVWHCVEEIARIRQKRGISDAYTAAWRGLRRFGARDIDTIVRLVLATRHPQSRELANELYGVHGTSAARIFPPLYRLKVNLCYPPVPVWRSIDAPADMSLEDLHQTNLALFAWRGDQSHTFEMNHRIYTGEATNLFAAEHSVRLDEAFECTSNSKVYYTVGAYWRFEISVQELVDSGSAMLYPNCVGGSGDCPGQSLVESDPVEKEGFTAESANRRIRESFSQSDVDVLALQ
ncbi:IS1096 element passenger TnpR family protein [Streptomyces sp. 900105245]